MAPDFSSRAASAAAAVARRHGAGEILARARSGSVLVADRLPGPDGRLVGCPAAPLVAGDLRRLGMPVTVGPLSAAAAGPESFVTLLSGEPVAGLGVTVTAGAPRRARLARAAVRRWAAVARPRTVLLASPRSFCAGVERAIEIVERALQYHDGPVYVRKQIVHNTHVVGRLERRGAVFVDDLDAVPDDAIVVFSAHGVSPAVRRQAAARRLHVIDATCPLVSKVHAQVRRQSARGDTVVLIGHAGHEEVEGTLGEAPGSVILAQDATDVADLSLSPDAAVSYVTQTTLATDETAEVIDSLRRRFPQLGEPDSEGICYATTNRQAALRAVADEADLVLVVGSANSSNSVRLVDLARRHGTPAQLIDDAGDIRAEWLAAATVIGLTAGASAPPALVHEIVRALDGLGGVTVAERLTTRENVHFGLPAAARRAIHRELS
jgi:4-hydroxy-3-methylbut-2-enyl diphosphate reductase